MDFKYLYRPREPRFWPGSDLRLHSSGTRFVQLPIQAYGIEQTLPTLGFYCAWNNTAEDKHGMKQYRNSPVIAEGKTSVSFWFRGWSPPTLWIRGIFLGEAKQIHVISVFQLSFSVIRYISRCGDLKNLSYTVQSDYLPLTENTGHWGNNI